MKHASLRPADRYPTGITPFVAVVLLAFLALALSPKSAHADALDELYGAPLDRTDFFDPLGGIPLADKDAGSTSTTPATRAAAHVEPMDLSEGMLSHLKYESGQNYDQGLSSGDGYHALGYFQFDNRYALGPFLEAVYAYDPTTYKALELIQDCYGWDVAGTTWEDDGFTQLGNDLNSVWHACYAANPTEFSQLQNYWAYSSYYAGPDGTSGSLSALGIDIDARPDIVRGLCWGVTSLFGPGGGAEAVKRGNYWGANWFFKSSGINDSMSDTELATTLCSYIIDHVAERYPDQSEYWEGWQRRYQMELEDCLAYLGRGDSGTQRPATQQMWRLYNPYTGEHFYTADDNERTSLITYGWVDEGIGWMAPKKSRTPVYRLYNSHVEGGDHHYTTDSAEHDALVEAGWTAEGIGWYSDDEKGVELLRQYNPHAVTGTHNYTADKNENDALVRLGWRAEGVAWYGVKQQNGV